MPPGVDRLNVASLAEHNGAPPPTTDKMAGSVRLQTPAQASAWSPGGPGLCPGLSIQ